MKMSTLLSVTALTLSLSVPAMAGVDTDKVTKNLEHTQCQQDKAAANTTYLDLKEKAQKAKLDLAQMEKDRDAALKAFKNMNCK